MPKALVACLFVGVFGCTRSESAAPATPANRDQARDAATSVAADSATRRGVSTAAITPPAPSAASATDTARGIVARVGSDPVSRLVLLPVPPSTAPTLALHHDARTPIDTAVGFEVMVEGTRTIERAMDAAPGGAIIFRVRNFVVRAIDGIPIRR